MLGLNSKASSSRTFASIAIAICSVILLSFSTFWFLGKFDDDVSVKSLFSPKRKVGVAEEINGLVPEFERRPRLFLNDSRYGPTEDVEHMPDSQKQEVLKNWAGLQARGYGFVPIHEPEKYTLPRPLKYYGLAPPDYYYSISAFHQIHCLDMILHEYLKHPVSASEEEMHEHGHSRRAEHEHKTSNSHIMHCFDYLRQAIQCCGDTALEGADSYSIAEGRDQVLVGTSGLETTHMCKDWNAIVEYAESHANPKWMGNGKSDDLKDV